MSKPHHTEKKGPWELRVAEGRGGAHRWSIYYNNAHRAGCGPSGFKTAEAAITAGKSFFDAISGRADIKKELQTARESRDASERSAAYAAKELKTARQDVDIANLAAARARDTSRRTVGCCVVLVAVLGAALAFQMNS